MTFLLSSRGKEFVTGCWRWFRSREIRWKSINSILIHSLGHGMSLVGQEEEVLLLSPCKKLVFGSTNPWNLTSPILLTPRPRSWSWVKISRQSHGYHRFCLHKLMWVRTYSACPPDILESLTSVTHRIWDNFFALTMSYRKTKLLHEWWLWCSIVWEIWTWAISWFSLQHSWSMRA